MRRNRMQNRPGTGVRERYPAARIPKISLVTRALSTTIKSDGFEAEESSFRKRPAGGYLMRIVKFCPLLLAAEPLLFTAPRLTAWDGTNSAARNANLELARQLNQAFVQVADEVSPVVVVITVTQKASATPQVDSG